jgi:hypothetical protein
MTQGSLFDMEAGKRGKEDGLARVAAHAPSAWMVKARALVVDVAKRKDTFTSDDVWQAGLETPPEPRALGAVMNELARAQLVEKTGQYVKTARKTRHNAPVAVWRLRAR